MSTKTNNLDYHYDKQHDILYISVGVPIPSYSEEILPGIFLRRNFDTDEVTGLTILNLKAQLQDNNLLLSKMPIPLNTQELEKWIQ